MDNTTNLPVDLLTWCRENEPSDNMVYKQEYWKQIMFIRDTLNTIFYNNREEYKANPVMVINTHTVKSIEMPVYEIILKDYDVKFILRNNFYDWKISVISKNDIEVDFMGIVDENEVINSVLCEGFKANQVFGCYKDNKKEFTFKVRSRYELYTIMYIIKNNLIKK